MSIYNLNLTLDNIRTITVAFFDILIMSLLIYYTLKLVRVNSRTIQIFKGILFVIVVDGLAKFFGLKTIAYFADIFLNWGFLAIIIIFQEEIRTLLEKLGKTSVFSRMNSLSGNEKENLVDQIVKATMLLSQDQTGALISIEQTHTLEDFIATGTKLNSDVTAELLTSIFVTSTPLHDGAVIIQGMKIACASAYFPPTNLDLPSRYGARHRAAIGISELTDAVTIVVSEETGAISITEGGKIFRVSTKQLRDYLMRVICGEEIEVQASRRKTIVPGRELLIEDDIRSGEVTLPKDNAEKTARGDTGVLSKLALKKQPAGKTAEKIEVEEVVAPETPQPEEGQTGEKHGIFDGLFGSRGEEREKNEEKMKELEEEASSIKLPKKKERPVPSYPEDSKHAYFEEETAPAEMPAAQVPAEEEEQDDDYRMTPEDVRKARERSIEKLTGKKAEIPPVDPYVNEDTAAAAEEEVPEETAETAAEEKPAEEERIYDTTKLDISKLMGFDDDFDSTFKMVDHLDTDSSDKNEGGDRS